MAHELLGLRQIPQSKWEDFSARVRAAKGKAILLVHPFFYSMEQGSTYERTVRKLLKQTALPVIILETTKHWQKNSANYPHNSLVIPTRSEGPAVILESERLEWWDSDTCHEELALRLSNAGLTSLRIGGMSSSEHGSETGLVREHLKKFGKKTTPPLIGYGCVGITYANLIKTGKFEKVELIPAALYPLRPGYYRSTKQFPEAPK